VSGFLGDPRSVIEFNATVLKANKSCPVPCYTAAGQMHSCCFATLRCAPPPSVLVPGPGLLTVRNNVGYSTNQFDVEYALLIDVALDRRPFVAERKARLLLRANASAVTVGGVTVVASLPDLPPAASAGWRHLNVSLARGGAVLELPFGDALPTVVNADMRVDITLPDGRTITKWRRFMRAPAARGSVEPVQVDHDRRGTSTIYMTLGVMPYPHSRAGLNLFTLTTARAGLLVDGVPFVGSGWCECAEQQYSALFGLWNCCGADIGLVN
jgi:hypothetical protein